MQRFVVLSISLLLLVLCSAPMSRASSVSRTINKVDRTMSAAKVFQTTSREYTDGIHTATTRASVNRKTKVSLVRTTRGSDWVEFFMTSDEQFSRNNETSCWSASGALVDNPADMKLKKLARKASSRTLQNRTLTLEFKKRQAGSPDQIIVTLTKGYRIRSVRISSSEGVTGFVVKTVFKYGSTVPLPELNHCA